jgi:anti-sigma regulatory factor (Ser/Thr protein kinase)
VVALNWPLTAPSPQDMRWLSVEDASAVVACRNAVLALADRLQFPAARAGQLALAVTEAASNLHKHAHQGSLWLCVDRDASAPGIALVTIDAGPGLADVNAAMRDGHSTAGTLGIGLGAICGQVVRFAGLGNIAASILSDGSRKSMISVSGIAGHQARTIRQFEYQVPPGAAVVLHSDGITSRWEAAALPGVAGKDPLLIVAVLLAEAGIHRDDAGVLVLKP